MEHWDAGQQTWYIAVFKLWTAGMKIMAMLPLQKNGKGALEFSWSLKGTSWFVPFSARPWFWDVGRFYILSPCVSIKELCERGMGDVEVLLLLHLLRGRRWMTNNAWRTQSYFLMPHPIKQSLEWHSRCESQKGRERGGKERIEPVTLTFSDAPWIFLRLSLGNLLMCVHAPCPGFWRIAGKCATTSLSFNVAARSSTNHHFRISLR